MKTIKLEPTKDGYKQMIKMFKAERDKAMECKKTAITIERDLIAAGTGKINGRYLRPWEIDVLISALEILRSEQDKTINKMEAAIEEASKGL